MASPLEHVLVVQPLMDLQTIDNPKSTVYIGPSNKSLFEYSASSFSANGGNLIFNNICAPSLSTVMDRNIRIAMKIQVVSTFAAATGGGQFNAVDAAGVLAPIVAGTAANANPTATACLRACPLAAAISSCEIRLNGGATSVALNQFSPVYPFLQGDDDVKRYASEMPLQHDNSAVYTALGVNSPFLPLNGNSNIPTRGSFLATRTAIGATSATYTIEYTEELFLSPFLTGHSMQNVGLCNVNNLTINVRLSDLNRMLSAVSVAGVSFVTTIVKAPILLVMFNAQTSILAARTPSTIVLPYSQIQTYTSSIANMSGAPGDALVNLEVAGEALRLPCLPSKIYLFACQTRDGINIPVEQQCDNFLRITKVQVNFNDKTNLLAGFDESSLYNMSAFNAGHSKAGFMNFNQWKYGCGSIVVIDVEKDLSIGDNGAQSGAQNMFSTLQCRVTFSNSNLKYAGAPALQAYTFYTTVISPGKAFVSPSQCDFSVMGPSPTETLSLLASGSNKVDEHEIPDGENPTGKGFMEHLSRGLSFVAKHVKPEHLTAGLAMLKKHTGGGAMHPRAYGAGGGISLG